MRRPPAPGATGRSVTARKTELPTAAEADASPRAARRSRTQGPTAPRRARAPRV
ncbi:hypothetical protein [Streptomyces sp. AJS327]|uniref:hypothetical protein n=1 Tax=Streptomyces sp. AJS327 TaxID=2545265 RepID=UPI0015DF36C2|nr:hypothetical protein [Streptomyces sp. AJS327]